MRSTTACLVGLALSLAAPASSLAQATFERLGYVHAARPFSRASNISSDGRFLVGTVGGAGPYQHRAFIWSRTGGLTLLEASRSEPLDIPSDVSDDGTVVVGSASPRGVIWIRGKVSFLPPIASPKQGLPEVVASGVSGDGRTAVGCVAFTRQGCEAARWRDGQLELLGHLPGDAYPIGAADIAEDGNPASLVGNGANAGYRAIRIAKGRVHDLGDIPGAGRGVEQQAFRVSQNGRRIIGLGSSATLMFGEGYLWSGPTGMIGLGTIPAALSLSQSMSISGDGRVVGGQTGTNQPYIYRGFIWDPVRGMRALDAVLDAYGINREGWSIGEVTGISRDGTAITGSAYDPTVTRGEAFLVTLPPWCWADCTGDGVVDFSDLLCFLNRFERAQDPRANPIDFFYCDLAADDEIDFNDFLAFLNLYNKGCGE